MGEIEAVGESEGVYHGKQDGHSQNVRPISLGGSVFS
jgi:hypothetical protein